MKGTIRTGAWIEVKYETKDGRIIWMEQFYPSLLKGSRLLDQYSAKLLSENDNINVINSLKVI